MNKKNPIVLKEIADKESGQFLIRMLLKAYDFERLIYTLSNHVASYNKDEKKSVKMSYKTWAIEIQNEVTELKNIAEKFRVQVYRIANENNKDVLTLLLQRAKAARKYFEPFLEKLSEKVLDHSEKLKKQSGVKKYVNELKDMEKTIFSQLKHIVKAEALIYSVVHGEELSRNRMNEIPLLKERGKDSRKKSVLTGEKQIGDDSTQKKSNTREKSYGFFKKGMSLEEIAKERSLSVSTIEGHLSEYVRSGEIKVNELVNNKAVQEIFSSIEKTGIKQLNILKENTKGKFSYGELRLVLAAYKHIKESEKSSIDSKAPE